MKKRLLSALLSVAMAFTCLSATTFAAGATTVEIGDKALQEGENSVGGGTATLDSANGTLTLENVSTSESIWIGDDGEFTVIVKGENSIGSEDSRTNKSAIYSNDVETLKVQIQEGATLSLYSENESNNIFVQQGNLVISGPGKLIANNSNGYASLYVGKDITLNEGLTAQIISDETAVFSLAGNIAVDSADLTIQSEYLGLFAQTYDENTDDSIPSSITMNNSKVNITARQESAVFCGTGGIKVENTELTVQVDEDVDLGCCGLYSEGDIHVSGAQTQITINGATGMSADNKIIIEDGTIYVSTSDVSVLGWEGVDISGGTIELASEQQSAILARDGALNVTGENTTVTASSSSTEVATIRNFRDGGLHLDAYVTAVNTVGKPFEGVKKDGSVAITLGDGFESDGLDIFTTDDGHSYFIPAGGDGNTPVTGSVDICKHVWGTPVWNWTEDYSSATATFTCTANPEHMQTVEAEVTSKTTDATCDEDGETAYTASVTFAGTVYTDEKKVEIPATGHIWGTPIWNWTEDHSSATATFTCTVDPEHTQTVEAEVTSKSIAASCSEDGKRVYTASVTFGGTVYINEDGEIIPATGNHNYQNGKCTVCGAADPNYKPVEPETPDTPQTGDHTFAVFCFSLVFVSGAGILGTIACRRKER